MWVDGWRENANGQWLLTQQANGKDETMTQPKLLPKPMVTSAAAAAAAAAA